MTAAVNVNMTPCTCRPGWRALYPGRHAGTCAAEPIPVPLSLEPWRSVAFTVRLGDCSLGNCYAVNPDGTPYSPETGGHGPGCPARPIRVTFSVSGETWEESEVASVSVIVNTNKDRPDNFDAYWAACRDRWALVKALVTGQDMSALDLDARRVGTFEMFTQRDAVFAALCEVASTEVANLAAQERLVSLLDPRRAMFRPTPEPARPSAQGLALYVERLIEQVGAL